MAGNTTLSSQQKFDFGLSQPFYKDGEEYFDSYGCPHIYNSLTGCGCVQEQKMYKPLSCQSNEKTCKSDPGCC